MDLMQSILENDKEYKLLVEDLIDNEDLLKLDEITHHHHTTRLKHSYYVSYVSYKIAKKLKLDARATARAGLLHDFFLEDREDIKLMDKGSHNYVHPKLALENAEKITEISELEKDIILKHMFLCTKCTLPKYRESLIVTCVDKYCAISEVTQPSRVAIKTKINSWIDKLTVVNA